MFFMKINIRILHLPHLKGVLYKKAEIIPNEPGRVMLPRECARRILEFLCFFWKQQSIINKE